MEEDEGVESNLWVVLDEPETTGGGGAAVEQGRRRWRTPARMLRQGRGSEAGLGSFTEGWGSSLCARIGEEAAVGRGSAEQCGGDGAFRRWRACSGELSGECAWQGGAQVTRGSEQPNWVLGRGRWGPEGGRPRRCARGGNGGRCGALHSARASQRFGLAL